MAHVMIGQTLREGVWQLWNQYGDPSLGARYIWYGSTRAQNLGSLGQWCGSCFASRGYSKVSLQLSTVEAFAHRSNGPFRKWTSQQSIGLRADLLEGEAGDEVVLSRKVNHERFPGQENRVDCSVVKKNLAHSRRESTFNTTL
jgi:hypothetical protein